MLSNLSEHDEMEFLPIIKKHRNAIIKNKNPQMANPSFTNSHPFLLKTCYLCKAILIMEICVGIYFHSNKNCLSIDLPGNYESRKA